MEALIGTKQRAAQRVMDILTRCVWRCLLRYHGIMSIQFDTKDEFLAVPQFRLGLIEPLDVEFPSNATAEIVNALSYFCNKSKF